MRLNANSRLIKGIDGNVARQIMMFPVTWVIPLVDSELEVFSLGDFLWN